MFVDPRCLPLAQAIVAHTPGIRNCIVLAPAHHMPASTGVPGMLSHAERAAAGDALPKSPASKVLEAELREQYRSVLPASGTGG